MEGTDGRAGSGVRKSGTGTDGVRCWSCYENSEFGPNTFSENGDCLAVEFTPHIRVEAHFSLGR